MHITEITPKIAQKAEKIRLAPYCRVSSDSADQMHSFATQIRYYSEYAKKNPQYEIVDIYADEGITGTEMEKRDELNRLLRDCRRGKIDRIITKSVSRFARNTEELIATLRMLKEFGVSVYFEEQGIDTQQMNMEMIVTFPGIQIDRNAVREMMIRYASMKYAEIDTEVYRAQRLRNVFIDNQPMHSFSAAFLERTTNEIMLYTDGSIGLILENGQEIRKGATYADTRS